MISKIYKSKEKSLTRAGDRKGKKNKSKAALYRHAARLARLRPRVARVVNYKDIDEQQRAVSVSADKGVSGFYPYIFPILTLFDTAHYIR